MNYDCLIVDDEIELAEATSEYFNMFEKRLFKDIYCILGM